MKKSVVILGLGVSGLAAARYLEEKNISLIGMDREPASRVSKNTFPIISDKDKLPDNVIGVVRSPGVPIDHPVILEAEKRKIPVVTDLELAFGDSRISRHPCIGITGSNGKTTTVEFLTHLIRKQGIPALAVGNIGVPLLDSLDFPGIRIIEISSFQSAMALEFPVLSAAAILNISSNHLDYHGSMESYSSAKYRIIRYLKNKENLFADGDIIRDLCGEGQSLCEYYKKVQALWDKGSALKDVYSHDKRNYCAALALARTVVDVSEEGFVEAVKTFCKPQHRLEFVANVSGVCYVNDSKATTFDSVIKAVSSVQGEVILLLGGRNKGGDFSFLVSQLLREVRNKIRKVIIFGESRNEILAAFSGNFDLGMVESLSDAVKLAKSEAVVGDTVLLSPGCASFDQFTSFEHRGEVFKQLVHSLRESLL
ncbi:UDP-N-acetylmuramoyl-L-alanine--D-glutamate ligase [Chlamydiifrater phoenicopteri]|uniref:UDP-N-acetylmuramoyl-L-alanine--D-glutamate ligase n=1 Tax=Chlamydiifrater phoenicopteri TaxID=2681469 RepID=UPI001BCCA017|nr:UDP-N-acetylmuramoyl-L-alanine--D-glutamate ligase [Chlamydiifrater phoenicopteri]